MCAWHFYTKRLVSSWRSSSRVTSVSAEIPVFCPIWVKQYGHQASLHRSSWRWAESVLVIQPILRCIHRQIMQSKVCPVQIEGMQGLKPLCVRHPKCQVLHILNVFTEDVLCVRLDCCEEMWEECEKPVLSELSGCKRWFVDVHSYRWSQPITQMITTQQKCLFYDYI